MKSTKTYSSQEQQSSRHSTRSLGLFFFLIAAVMCNAQLLVPFTGSNSLACGTNTVLRDHMSYTTYSNNANGYTVLDAGFQSAITISGNYITEASFDYVRIYNGVGTGGTMLLNVSGTGNINFTGSPGQTLTVQFITDGSVVYQGFNLNITYNGPCFATPCAGVPPSNSVVSPTYMLCSNNSTANLALGYTYSLNGLTYQWQSSTTSSVGPFTAITNATNTSFLSPTASVTTWYQVVVTCTNSSSSTVTIPGQVMIASTTVTNNVPYYESFEGIGQNDRMPNCSWAASGMFSTTRTYTASATGNRIPRTGNSFAAFSASPAGTRYYYTNGIMMYPGITYSANLWYTTDLTGANNWSNFGILLGTSQASTGLTPIAVVNGAAISPVYKSLGNTFTVQTAGIYYVAIRATGGSGNAQYLSWDDLSITIPCDAGVNSPTVTLSASSATICDGEPVVITATGADTFTSSGIPLGSNSFTDSPNVNTTYVVVGTKTLTGCQSTASVSVKVNKTPNVNAAAIPSSVCPNKPVTLMANGASTYMWSTTQTGGVITLTPTASGTYSVNGTATNGCVGKASVSVTVYNSPTVTANTTATTVCKNDNVTLTALGANTFKWVVNTSGQVYQGTAISLSLTASSSFTVFGADGNGCESSAVVSVNVLDCTGLSEFGGTAGRIFPNPATTALTIESAHGLISAVEVTDLTGRVLLSRVVNGEQAQVDVSGLPAGSYFVRINTAAASEMVRFIKE
jgi:hypothetical protein